MLFAVGAVYQPIWTTFEFYSCVCAISLILFRSHSIRHISGVSPARKYSNNYWLVCSAGIFATTWNSTFHKYRSLSLPPSLSFASKYRLNACISCVPVHACVFLFIYSSISNLKATTAAARQPTQHSIYKVSNVVYGHIKFQMNLTLVWEFSRLFHMIFIFHAFCISMNLPINLTISFGTAKISSKNYQLKWKYTG